MTKINDAHGTVTLAGVKVFHDIPLRKVWLAYAEALGPFDFVVPLHADPHRPNLNFETGAAEVALKQLRMASALGEDSDFRQKIRQWLTCVDSVHGIHGIRQTFVRKLAVAHGLPVGKLAAEPLLRARVDDAMVRLEGREYSECYTHVLGELQSMLSNLEFADLRNHSLHCCANT